MREIYFIRLSGLDLGQLLDGLRIREESWRKTAAFLREGYIPDDTFVCEECKSEYEAESIADHYKRLVTDLEKQREEQNSTNANLERRLYLDGKSDGQLNLITRIEANWSKIRRCAVARIRSELMRLTDDICDD